MAMGVQVGDGNTQIIYSYSGMARTDGIAPPPLAGILEAEGSPYRGLNAFGQRDAPFFFGRETATAQILERLSAQLADVGLLVVSGVSGAGKSSLLRAGVLPSVHNVGLAGAPGSAAWPCLVITPTRAPLDELASGVAALAGTDAGSVRRDLDDHPERFALAVRQAAEAGPGEPAGSGTRRLLLVIDQFEQLFTQCADEGQRRAFIAALHAAATVAHGADQTPAGLVVLAVRADFEARCADYAQLTAVVQGRYLVTSMTERQLRLAITEPAKVAGSEVDGALVEELLREVRFRPTASSPVGPGHPGASGAGVLPLLSHALDQAWRHRTGDVLGLADYERSGGIEGGVAASAQRAYDNLTPARQQAARPVFIQLTTTSTEGLNSAGRVGRDELTEGRSPAPAADVQAVLEAFAAERLLTLGPDYVEISHEVLLTAWDRLREWLDGDQIDRILYGQLTADARTWDANGRSASYLYRPGRLAEASAAAARWASAPSRYPSLTPACAAFLRAASRAARRARRRQRAVTAVLLALVVAATTAAGIAGHYAANANRQHAIALSRELAAESLSLDAGDPVTARQLAVAAWSVYPTSQAISAVTTLLTEQQQNGELPVGTSPVDGVAFSPDGKLLATGSADGWVRLWDPDTGRLVGRPLHAGSGADPEVEAVAFSPNGKLLAAVSDGNVQLWNPATGRPAPLQPAQGDGVEAVAFSPDGKLLATAARDGDVRLWNPATGRLVSQPLPADPGQNGGVEAVAFSPDGTLLATADANGYARLWNPATGQPVGHPIGETLPDEGSPAVGVGEMAFSPDGRLLAEVGGDNYLRLWNPATGSPVGPPLPGGLGLHGGVQGVAFSPGGILLAGADDTDVQLWNPVTGRPMGKPMLTNTGLSAVAFRSDGKLLASGDQLGYVRLWDPATGRPVGKPLPPAPGQDGGVEAIAFRPGGSLLAIAQDGSNVQLWNPGTGRPAARPLPASLTYNDTEAIAFSPDGKLLATADADGYVRLWDVATGQPVGQPLPANPGQDGGVAAVAFSPDGTLLASATSEGAVQLWPTWLVTDPYAALCADAGPLASGDWKTYAADEPQPAPCDASLP